jgi:hypothetical protein
MQMISFSAFERRMIQVFFVCFVFSVSVQPSRSSDLNTCDESDPLCVDRPFASITAIENLKKCVKVEDDEGQKLSQISKISYVFDPAEGADLPNREILLDRTTTIKSSALGSNRIVQAIEAQRGGNCETDTKIWNISVSLASRNRIAVSYSAQVDKRDCGHFLGIPYKNDVGSGGADVHLVYRLTDTFGLQEESRVLTNEWRRRNWTYSVLGFVLPAIGSFGAIALQIKQEIEIASITVSGASASTLTATFANDFQVLAAGLASAEDFARDVDLLHAPVWDFQRDPGLTGLVELGGSESTLQLAERVSIRPKLFGPKVFQWKKEEIKAIYELRFPRPRIHTVVRGESLWSIASKYYTEPKMFALIESASGLKRTRIRPGQGLIVPFYTELCDQNNQGRIVRPGDNVWALRQKHVGYNPSPREFRSKRLRLIYPFETVRLPATSTGN